MKILLKQLEQQKSKESNWGIRERYKIDPLMTVIEEQEQREIPDLIVTEGYSHTLYSASAR